MMSKSNFKELNFNSEYSMDKLRDNPDALTIIFVTSPKAHHYSKTDYIYSTYKLNYLIPYNKTVFIVELEMKPENPKYNNVIEEERKKMAIENMTDLINKINSIESNNKIIIIDVDLYILYFNKNRSRVWSKDKIYSPEDYKYSEPMISMDPKIILNEFNKLEGHVYPAQDLQYIVGTKQYYKWPEIKELLYPFSGVYPDDKKKILNLPTGEYVFKFGLSSGADGIYFYKDLNGKDLVNIIEKYTSFPANEMVLVQTYNPAFMRCCEYKFFVVDGQINAVFCQHLTSEISPDSLHTEFIKDKTEEKFLIDPKVYKLIKKVWQIFFTKYNVMYLRIDIILDTELCSTYHDLIDNKHNYKYNYNVYLNEVETFASGLKIKSHLEIEDTGQEAYILNKNNFEPIIYGKIIDNLLARY